MIDRKEVIVWLWLKEGEGLLGSSMFTRWTPEPGSGCRLRSPLSGRSPRRRPLAGCFMPGTPSSPWPVWPGREFSSLLRRGLLPRLARHRRNSGFKRQPRGSALFFLDFSSNNSNWDLRFGFDCTASNAMLWLDRWLS